MRGRPFTCILGALLILRPVVSGSNGNVNVTLDLSNNNVVGLFANGTWNTQSTSPICGSTQNGTTDYFTTTTGSYLTAQFRGTAVYVSGIRTTSSGEASFKVDDDSEQNIQLESQSTICGSELFNFVGLPDDLHTLTITLFAANSEGNGSTTPTLDITEIIYTQSAADASSSSSTSPSATSTASTGSHSTAVGPIVGGVVGGVAGLSIIGIVLFCFLRSRRRSPNHHQEIRPTRGKTVHHLDGGDLDGSEHAPHHPISGITPFVIAEEPSSRPTESSYFPPLSEIRDHKRRPSTPDSATFSGVGESEADTLAYRPLFSHGMSSDSSSRGNDYNTISQTGHLRTLSSEGPRSMTSVDPPSTSRMGTAEHTQLVREVAREIAAALIPQGHHAPFGHDDAGSSHMQASDIQIITEPPPEYREHGEQPRRLPQEPQPQPLPQSPQSPDRLQSPNTPRGKN